MTDFYYNFLGELFNMTLKAECVLFLLFKNSFPAFVLIVLVPLFGFNKTFFFLFDEL